MSFESEARISQAEAFLREAVFRSRAFQAVRGPGPAADGSGQCGLGEKAAVVLDLSDAGRELYGKLWPHDLPEGELETVREVMRAWVQEQDALDRKRNHFLKAFRRAHGGDRTTYTAAEQAEYDAGLSEVNAEANAHQRAAAKRLLAVD